MNCSIFKKKLNDYIEGNMQEDMKDAMKHHEEECASCSKIYNIELSVDSAFKQAFDNNISFTSSRADIMRTIDKNRYGKGLGKRLHYHFKRYYVRYMSCAAIIAITAIIAPNVLKQSHNMVSSNSAKQDMAIAKKGEASIERKSALFNANVDVSGAEKASMDVKSYISPSFIKVGVMPEENMLQSNTPWKSSPSKKFSACIEGRGPEGEYDGVGTIYVKEPISGSIWMLNDLNNSGQYTPKFISWWDDENIIVVEGYAYGTISSGESLYLVNVNTAQSSLIYSPENDRTRVISAERLGDKVQMKLLTNDESLNNSNKAELICPQNMETLVSANKGEEAKPEAKVIYDFAQCVNTKNYSSAFSMLAPGLKGAYESDNEKPLKNIIGMNIIKIEEKPGAGVDRTVDTYYSHKVYYAEVYYMVRDENYSSIKNGIYNHKIVVVQEKKDSPWRIAEMSASSGQ